MFAQWDEAVRVWRSATLPLCSSTEVASARPQGDVAELCFTDASSLSVTLLRSDWVAWRLFGDVVSGSWMVALPSLER